MTPQPLCWESETNESYPGSCKILHSMPPRLSYLSRPNNLVSPPVLKLHPLTGHRSPLMRGSKYGGLDYDCTACAEHNGGLSVNMSECHFSSELLV